MCAYNLCFFCIYNLWTGIYMHNFCGTTYTHKFWVIQFMQIFYIFMHNLWADYLCINFFVYNLLKIIYADIVWFYIFLIYFFKMIKENGDPDSPCACGWTVPLAWRGPRTCSTVGSVRLCGLRKREPVTVIFVWWITRSCGGARSLERNVSLRASISSLMSWCQDVLVRKIQVWIDQMWLLLASSLNSRWDRLAAVQHNFCWERGWYRRTT